MCIEYLLSIYKINTENIEVCLTLFLNTLFYLLLLFLIIYFYLFYSKLSEEVFFFRVWKSRMGSVYSSTW